ncbi:MBL fold metallo-hydrolase [Candidatus Bathyarchaeota archaeon]|nr:MBL fold metallo-hydrolase [Candidatus Bathyarchaeota archaeon]
MRIAQDIYLIKCPFSTYFTSVVAILGDTIAIIDAGMSSSPKEAIIPFLKGLGRDSKEISQILLTHGHFDHCGGAKVVKDLSGAEVLVHEADRGFVEDPGLMDRELHRRFPDLYPELGKPTFEAISVDKGLKEGDRLILGGHEFEVLHTPGHSPGSICLLERNLGLCIAGDSIQGRGERRPLLFHSASAYADSMRRLSMENPHSIVLGHPFPPLKEAFLEGEAAKRHVEESLKAIEDLKGKVLEVLKEHGALSIQGIQGRIDGY